MKTGLTLSVLRDAGLGDHTNGGISGTHNRITALHPDLDGPFEPSESAPAMRLEDRGRYGWRLVPLQRPEGMIGPMFGGNYATSCDSRLSRLIGLDKGAIPIHDRFETPADYDDLSR